MSSSLRRGTLAASALALSIPALAACGAGNDAQTLEIKPDNAAVTEGTIKIQNVNVVTTREGKGPATVVARLFNSGDRDQTVKAVAVSGVKATLTPPKNAPGRSNAVVVPAGGSVAFGGQVDGKDNKADEVAVALIESIEKTGARNGNAQPVVFDLSSTGVIKLRATVVPNTHHWKEYGPKAQPSLPEASPSDSPSGEPDDSGDHGSETPGGDESGEASTAATPGASSPQAEGE
ncbi:DUF461 domain-containing protein [Streptomyces sp. NPDC005438]|uniref:DUF461 domain-containing protein n=1 Tax=Streptomyces sp. NPDC005438 TaxID=3156880 RepID=UPI0033B961DF